MDRDELFIELCQNSKLLTAAQIEECRKLQSMLSENGFSLTFSEIVAKKEILNPHQLRLVNVAIRYEEMRQVDVELGDFILRKGFLPIEKLNECLSAQETPYREGRHFPRLEDLLVQKGHLNAQQLHVILRAWEQLDQVSAIGKPGSSPRMPRMQPAVPPQETKTTTLSKLPTAPLKPPAPPLFDRKTLETGLLMDGLKVTVRRSRIKDKESELTVHILELQGSLDGHSSRKLDSYVNSLIDSQAVRLVADCKKLDYISSAGIGVLAGAVKRCRDAKGDFRVCSVNDKVNKIMGLVGIQSIMRFYADERGAIMSFKYS
jgi:anti-sigma B factor antagonist